MHTKTIAIAGATGFIGSRLCQVLPTDFNVIALSRRIRPETDGLQWRSCDLYDLDSCIDALKGVDSAVYLVHSMMPSARLTQASFEDLDLILADNFARAAEQNGIKHIVYVGGLDPDTPDTSIHLSSRMEVEQVLANWVETVTALRAGLVIGHGGSSFEVLEDVVAKLPLILCPSWTESKMQPIGVRNLVTLIRHALIEGGPDGCHDVGTDAIMTYKELMVKAAKQLNKNPVFLPSPIDNPELSSLGVSILTGKPTSLITPLLHSLKHDMLTRHTVFQSQVIPKPQTFAEAFEEARQDKSNHGIKATKSRRKRLKKLKQESAVRSVQRMPMPKNRDAFWLAERYLRWLPRAFRWIVRAEYVEGGISRMYLQGTQILLLELRFQRARSTADRAVYTISDGTLVRPDTLGRGTFEFRIMLDPSVLITAIHDFHPRLPWYIYKVTQAQMHSLVMAKFSDYLEGIAAKDTFASEKNSE